VEEGLESHALCTVGARGKRQYKVIAEPHRSCGGKRRGREKKNSRKIRGRKKWKMYWGSRVWSAPERERCRGGAHQEDVDTTDTIKKNKIAMKRASSGRKEKGKGV